jgi:predicted DNA binding CopG/RHH family protein
MSQFAITTSGIKNISVEFEAISNNLGKYKAQIGEVSNQLDSSLSMLCPSLTAIAANTNKHAISMHNHSLALNKIATTYEATDNSIKNNITQISIFNPTYGPIASAGPCPVSLTDIENALIAAGATAEEVEAILAAIAAAIAEPGFLAELLLISLLVAYGLTQLIPAIIDFIESLNSQSEAEAEDSASTGSQADDDSENEENNSDENNNSDDFDLDKLTRSQRKAVESAENNINDHLTEADLEAAKGDLEGNPIPKKGGGYWDHAQEVRNAYAGIKRAAETIANSLLNPNLAEDVREFLQNELDKIYEYMRRIEEIFAPYGGIDG